MKTTNSNPESLSVLTITLTRQSQTADSVPGVATKEVTSSARKVVQCVRWPANGITAHSL